MTKYPQILEDIAEFLRNNSIQAANDHDEGRRNSQTDEDHVVALLQERFGSDIIVKEPKPRWWYDFIVIDGDKGYPVNFKSSATLAQTKKCRPDNAGQKIGMLYSLTDIPFEKTQVKGNLAFKLKGVPGTFGDDKFNELLISNKGDAQRDYFYLVMNKVDTSEILLIGLRDLVIADTPRNSSYNLPYQVDWRDNRSINHRTFKQAWAHVGGRYQNNVRARIEVLSSGGLLDETFDVEDNDDHLIGF